jgi:hypothetical protein
MSRLVRVLVAGGVLVALSLGGTAYAQDAQPPSQPGGVIQPAPSPDPQAGNPGTPGSPGTPGPAQNPGTPANPGTPGDTTTTTSPPVARPKSLPVTVSPQAGSPGTTVTVRADLRGCTRPDSADGFFQEVYEWGTDGMSRWLVWERVTGGRWYQGQFLITKAIPPGLGRFGVVCDNGQLDSIDGYTTFLVQPSSPLIPIQVTPQVGGPGTTVRITADLPACGKFQIDRYDSRGRKSNDVAKGPAWDGSPGRITVGRYTIASSDPVGQMRFVVTCFVGHDPLYHGSASFQVRSPSSGGGSGGSGGGAGGNNPTGNDNTQFPKRIDTGQGGTADGISHDGLDPVLLLPAAGLVLIALAAGLWLRQTTTRRQQ